MDEPRRFFLVIRRFQRLRTSWRSQLTKRRIETDPQERLYASSEPIAAGMARARHRLATRISFGESIASARTVLWNGPMGVFEDSL